MPIVDGDNPATARDHEILALANDILKCCHYKTADIVFAGIAQAFLGFMGAFEHDIDVPTPQEYDDAARSLTHILETIRGLPQDRVQ